MWSILTSYLLHWSWLLSTPLLCTTLAMEPTDCTGGAFPRSFPIYGTQNHIMRDVCLLVLVNNYFFFCLSHEGLAVLILLKVPSELAQPLRIPSWLRHLILCMNSINLPPRIWERWVSSSSLICDSSPAWKTIEIKPSRKVEGTELSPRPLQRKVHSCLQVYGVGCGCVCEKKHKT